MNRYMQPIPHIIKLCVPYESIIGRLRQKMSKIQYSMIELRRISNIDYRLYVDGDSCILVDTLYNKILWHFDFVEQPFILLEHRLDELKKFWYYEKNKNSFKNRVEVNDYLSLKKKYHYE